MAGQQQQRPPLRFDDIVPIPMALAGRVIGRNAVRLQELQELYPKCRVEIPRRHDVDQRQADTFAHVQSDDEAELRDCVAHISCLVRSLQAQQLQQQQPPPLQQQQQQARPQSQPQPQRPHHQRPQPSAPPSAAPGPRPHTTPRASPPPTTTSHHPHHTRGRSGTTATAATATATTTSSGGSSRSKYVFVNHNNLAAALRTQYGLLVDVRGLRQAVEAQEAEAVVQRWVAGYTPAADHRLWQYYRSEGFQLLHQGRSGGEQAVDSALHDMLFHQVLQHTSAQGQPGCLVVVTGDGSYDDGDDTSVASAVEEALELGWTAQLWRLRHTPSQHFAWLKARFSAQVQLRDMDDYVEQVGLHSGPGGQPPARPRSQVQATA